MQRSDTYRYAVKTGTNLAAPQRGRKRKQSKGRLIRILIFILCLTGLILWLLVVLASMPGYIEGQKNDYQGSNIADNKAGGVGMGISDAEADSAETELNSLFEETGDLRFEKLSENIDKYPLELIELAVRNPETIEFVTEYIGHKTADAVNIETEEERAGIPLFIQWDRRWGYEKYGTSMMGLSGCGPTSLSMVVVGLTGNYEADPKAIAKFAMAGGYVTEENSTAWDLLRVGCESFGISAEEIPLDENIIKKNLNDGKPIIASVKEGVFTTASHIIVMAGVAPDGSIIINDPNSKIRSNTLWSYDDIMDQIRNMWAYTKL